VNGGEMEGRISKGIVHTRANLAISAGFAVGGLLVGNLSGFVYGAGSLIGIFVSSDCDVNNGHIADKYIRNKFGKVVEKIWDGIWYFYRRSFSHGGELSHFPVICTIGRIIYLYFLFIVVPHVAYYYTFHPAWDLWYVLNWYVDRIRENDKIIIGLMYGDFGHWVLDVLTKEHGKKKVVTNGTQDKGVRRDVRDSIRNRLPHSSM
jgi:uncharacterized metal-binding protein